MSNDSIQQPKESGSELTAEQLPSIAAGISWVFGVMSIPLLLIPPSAIATGLIAVVFGHAAKFSIKRRLELSGAATATNGLIMGYLCLLIALVLLPSIHMQSTLTKGIWESYRGVSQARADNELAEAEIELLSGGNQALGNNEAAVKISADLNQSLNELRHETFDGPASFDVRTFCQTSPDGTCVVVLIPDFAEFGDEARTAMQNLAWQESQKVAFGTPLPGDEFAVAVRDRMRYHAMEFGRATKSPDRIAQPDASFVDMELLENFFGGEVESPVEDEAE